MIRELPNPGSDEAIDLGCSCAVMDNRRGEGVMMLGEGPFFWVEGDCPLHGTIASRSTSSDRQSGEAVPALSAPDAPDFLPPPETGETS